MKKKKNHKTDLLKIIPLQQNLVYDVEPPQLAFGVVDDQLYPTGNQNTVLHIRLEKKLWVNIIAKLA